MWVGDKLKTTLILKLLQLTYHRTVLSINLFSDGFFSS